MQILRKSCVGVSGLSELPFGCALGPALARKWAPKGSKRGPKRGFSRGHQGAKPPRDSPRAPNSTSHTPQTPPKTPRDHDKEPQTPFKTPKNLQKSAQETDSRSQIGQLSSACLSIIPNRSTSHSMRLKSDFRSNSVRLQCDFNSSPGPGRIIWTRMDLEFDLHERPVRFNSKVTCNHIPGPDWPPSTC